MRALLVAGLALGAVLLSSARAQAQQVPSWQLRFERERPAILRAIEGVPGPPGYEQETHYDRRRMLLGSVTLGLGAGLQLLGVASRGVDAAELIPCAGLFYGDYDERSAGSGWIDTKQLGRAFLSLPVCAAFLVGTLEIGRGLLDARPVWVRQSQRPGSLRLGGVITGQEARIHAIGYF